MLEALNKAGYNARLLRGTANGIAD
jgi:hypothetical protein